MAIWWLLKIKGPGPGGMSLTQSLVLLRTLRSGGHGAAEDNANSVCGSVSAAFFQDCISEQDLDEMNIEIIRNTLYKVRPCWEGKKVLRSLLVPGLGQELQLSLPLLSQRQEPVLLLEETSRQL